MRPTIAPTSGRLRSRGRSSAPAENACPNCRPGTCSRRVARARRRAPAQVARERRFPLSYYSLEPLRKQQRPKQKQRQEDGQRKADDVFVAHNPSTNFTTRPSRAKIATVSTMYTKTPILSPFAQIPCRYSSSSLEAAS